MDICMLPNPTSTIAVPCWIFSSNSSSDTAMALYPRNRCSELLMIRTWIPVRTRI